MKIITGLADITLVDTPVTISKWTQDGRVNVIEYRPMAELFKAVTRLSFRPATLVTCTVYGDPFVRNGRLVSAAVKPRPAGGRSKWTLYVRIIPPGKRNPDGFERDFPVDAALLMWGAHDISLADLPPLTTPLRWHCKNFAATWHEVARRCHATGSVWLDTTAAAIENRKMQMAERDRDDEESPR